jgi:orotidine-5'-phosphate decarboxylase
MFNPIFCAIDTKDVAQAKVLAASIAPHVGGIKLGLEFFVANGAAGVAQVVDGLNLPIFLDLKFHDIPNTVAQAVRSAVRHLDIAILTVHACGGKTMMEAAAQAAREEADACGKAAPIVVGVTVLTSMSQDDLAQTGAAHDVESQVKALALLAKASGLDGVVCSAKELEIVKQACGRDFKAVVPGIRPAGSDANDQKRVMTPQDAMAHGADYLVIGRPITQSEDPAGAAKAIASTL